MEPFDVPVDVVVVGSLNLDLVVRTTRLPQPGETVTGSSYAEHAGGKGLNQAVSAARSGAQVAMVGAVGDDHAGTTLRQVVTDEGINDAGIVTLGSTSTGRASITVDDAAENSIVVIAGANAAAVIAELPPCRVVLGQLEVPIDTITAAFVRGRAMGATTVLNPAPAVDLPAELLAVTDVVVPNQHELALLGGAEALFERGVRDLVVTLGGDGVDLLSPDGERHHVDAFAVEPVDTTGAGDAFCGALAARLATGVRLLDAVPYAAAAGALATTVPGAVPSQPRRDDVESLLAAGM